MTIKHVQLPRSLVCPVRPTGDHDARTSGAFYSSSDRLAVALKRHRMVVVNRHDRKLLDWSENEGVQSCLHTVAV
jgi:hypothetical protein